MEANYLVNHVKQAAQKLAFLLAKPESKELYQEIWQITVEIRESVRQKEDPLLDTLTYGLVCTADFIQTIHPSGAEKQWFHNKITENLNLLEEMAASLALQNTTAFNSSASKLIENNSEIDHLQIHLVLTKKRALMNNAISLSDILLTSVAACETLDKELIEMLVFALFQMKGKKLPASKVEELVDKLALLTNPLATEKEKATYTAEAHELAKGLELYPDWYNEEMSKAEIAETKRLLENLHKMDLADSFLLFNIFKRRYKPTDSSYIVFSSFAKACLLTQKLLFAGNTSALSSLTKVTEGLLLFLENRYTSDDKVKEASDLMRTNYRALITEVDNLHKK